MGTEVKFFHSNMVAAPVLSGTAGAVLGILDACLADGFDTKSVTSGAIAGGIATINWSGSFSGEAEAVVLVAGLTPSGLNGERRVLTKSGTSLTFATGLADGSITVGSGTVKMAPLGWAKTYTGTNKRAYKPSDVAATGCLLRIDDAGTTTCRAVGYETMSDVDTGTGPFPTAAQLSGGTYWPKSSAADATSRPWMVVGDSRGFYFWCAPSTSQSNLNGVAQGFGDLASFKASDAYACVMCGSASSGISTAASPVASDLLYAQPATYASAVGWVARSYTATGTSKDGRQSSSYAVVNGYSGQVLNTFPYPNAADNGLMVSEVLFMEQSPVVLRGLLPGIYHSPQLITVGTFATFDKITGAGPLAGKTLLTARVGSPNNVNQGFGFFDITGPWVR
jgi:hypothetical protein